MVHSSSKRKTTPKTARNERAFGALIDTRTGNLSLIEPKSDFFQKVSNLMGWDRTVAGVFGTSTRRTTTEGWYEAASGSRRASEYQRLTGTTLPSLRERLLPAETDYARILDRQDFYTKRIPWLKRGLRLRASFNASEFRVDAPGDAKQSDWMLGVQRNLRMFSFMREFFWVLFAHEQVLPLWRTAPDGRTPRSIECADPRVYQTRFNPFDGSKPRVVVVPSRDSYFAKLAQDAQSSDNEKKSEALRLLQAYPKPYKDAALDSGWQSYEIPAEELEPYGMHFDHAAHDRRHWEDWGFPGMFSVFPQLEMLLLADDADINALHHYKAGILLVRLGPPEPRAGDEAVMPTEGELKAIDAKLVSMVKARLPAWSARGDLRIDWVVPPENIISDAKVKHSKERVLDWLGIPLVFWPGQDFKGAFASAQIALKALQQESKDERDIAKEWAEARFHGWAEASNQFEGAEWPSAWFDPTALQDPRWVLDMVRIFMQYGGADEQTIAEILDFNAKSWLWRNKGLKDLKREWKTDFAPEFVPKTQVSSRPDGRPATVGQPTPESDGTRQPRPSTSASVEVGKAAEVVEREFGISASDIVTALEREGIVED